MSLYPHILIISTRLFITFVWRNLWSRTKKVYFPWFETDGYNVQRFKDRQLHAYRDSALFASFLKEQGHPGIFSLVKGTAWGNFYRRISRAPRQWPTGGVEAIASVKYQACKTDSCMHTETSTKDFPLEIKHLLKNKHTWEAFPSEYTSLSRIYSWSGRVCSYNQLIAA